MKNGIVVTPYSEKSVVCSFKRYTEACVACCKVKATGIKRQAPSSITAWQADDWLQGRKSRRMMWRCSY